MPSEPIYTFEKGKGWVPTSTPDIEEIYFVSSDGYRMCLINRPPKFGEFYCTWKRFDRDINKIAKDLQNYPASAYLKSGLTSDPFWVTIMVLGK